MSKVPESCTAEFRACRGERRGKLQGPFFPAPVREMGHGCESGSRNHGCVSLDG